MRGFTIAVAALLLGAAAGAGADVEVPTRAEVEASMGLPSDGDRVRGQMDTVGFVVHRAEAEEVVAAAVALEADALARQDRVLGMQPTDGFVGGVCPHDDHLYAGGVYVHLTERITAPRVILVGVFHAARLWDLRDRLVFDSFASWHAPWGDLLVDPLRDQIIGALPVDTYVVDNAIQSREHSLEALLPFLQHNQPQRSIVPILVSPMGWQRIEELSDQLAAAVTSVMKRNNWELGRDLAIVVSSDAVHYGPDFDHAPFGTDVTAYQRAVSRDRRLAAAYLEGTLTPAKLHTLLDTLVEPDDLSYRLPWCGRFSVPFGLEVLRKVAIETAGAAPTGELLKYGTSLDGPELPVSVDARKGGLGYTAPSNLHHWVGYIAVGFLMP
jgi:AmmeMemoRadiSam system protein B